MLTVYGIETTIFVHTVTNNIGVVATVLTVYGIETIICTKILCKSRHVATVLTVYGIETGKLDMLACVSGMLQQCLPFTVLKR